MTRDSSAFWEKDSGEILLLVVPEDSAGITSHRSSTEVRLRAASSRELRVDCTVQGGLQILMAPRGQQGV